ncbi:MAG: TIGR03013 family PEP-CTERM/XrtA system glycosyltransferase [Acetobacteraceae bacterium]|nr:TIGR03013 family PEP-CTERM/XrtA system glycosyltransferase [Acetobacteraceae bacterium]
MRSLKVLLSRAGIMLVALDTALLLPAWPVLLWLVSPEHWQALLFEPALAVFPLAQVTLLYALGLYRRDAILSLRRALLRLPLVVGLGALASGVVLLAVQWLWPGTATVDVTDLCSAAMLGFALCATLARVVLFLLLRRGVFRRRIMVVGAGQRAAELIAMIGQHASAPQFDLVFVHEPALGPREPELGRGAHQTVVLASDSNYLQLATAHDVDQIVVAPDERRGMRLERLLDCKKNGFPVVQHLEFVEREARRVDLNRIELGWFLYSDGFYFGPLDRALKRMLDIAVSLVILLFGSLLLLPAAIAIKLGDGGPIFYAQTRVSQGGRHFRILKLRTMRVDAERGGAVWAATADSRITRTGRFLRQTRIDELPQLINVLRGEMSLVGPRPERPEFIGALIEQIPLYDERHTVKAGLTGWAQINYPYGASIEDTRAKLGYDLYYVKNFSVAFDLLIILQTLRVVLFPSGAR